jgi:hypothetical protein
MPANLNALIRYKTINSCLYGGRKKYNIQELIDACSDALNESRGRGVSISERTVRDDLRVMRSDILGFNAPIEQKKGLYFYSDPRYTILSVGITEPGILDAVIKTLIKIRKEVKHPELEIVLGKLKALSPESFDNEWIEIAQSQKVFTRYTRISQERNEVKSHRIRQKVKTEKQNTDPGQKPMMSFSPEPAASVLWGDLMTALFQGQS